jgi:excisionase family DNA binding protein
VGTFPGHSWGRLRRTVAHMHTPSVITTDSTGSARPLIETERLVFTVAEAGELLGISRAFAYELVAHGELPVLRLGRRMVVPKASLLALCGVEPSAT